MKKTFTLSMILTFAIGFCLAGTISEQTAKNVAVNFFKANASSSKLSITAHLVYTQQENDNTVDFYAFNISPKGFVIVSADDNVLPVIAYSAESNFNTNFKQTGINDWVNHAAKNIYSAIQNHAVANSRISSSWKAYENSQNPGSAKSSFVSPLLSTTWNQDTFYNQFCPFSTPDQQRCVTGCVATSMGQIMKFWNFPAQGTGSYSYNNCAPNYTYNYGIQSADFGATTYSWDSMPASLTGPNSQVATLLYQCGVGVAMSYGDEQQGGSAAYVLQSDVPSWKHSSEYAFKNYFLYNPNTLTDLHSSNYTSVQWISMIENELNLSHPVLYIGLDTLYGGHAWVCDGYDQNDMLHMNWGWGGQGDGYYSVSNLSVDGFNFSNDEGALIGIIPNISTPVVSASVSRDGNCSGDTTNIIASGSSLATYSWTPVTGLDCPTCAVTIAHPLTTTTYTVTMDSAGFTSKASVTIKVSSAIIISGLVNNVACFGGADGSASLSVSGGSSGFVYNWNNGQSTATVSGLSAGAYVVTVYDAAGCSASATENISQPEVLRVDVKVDNDFNATAEVSGGTAAYSFLWNTRDNTASISNMSTGDYNVTVTDAHSCTATSATVSVINNNTEANQGNTGSNAATGISSVENNRVTFSVYPNPAKNVLNVKLGNLNSEVSMSVRNILGENLISRTISSMNTQLDLSSLAAGIYFISLTVDGHSSVQQFSISR